MSRRGELTLGTEVVFVLEALGCYRMMWVGKKSVQICTVALGRGHKGVRWIGLVGACGVA